MQTIALQTEPRVPEWAYEVAAQIDNEEHRRAYVASLCRAVVRNSLQLEAEPQAS